MTTTATVCRQCGRRCPTVFEHASARKTGLCLHCYGITSAQAVQRAARLAQGRQLRPEDMSEGQLQAYVVKLAKARGWMAYHTHDSRRSERGFPDLVLVHAGRKLAMFVELKSPTGRLTIPQQNWIDAMKAAGLDARVWRPSDLEEIEATL